MLSRRFLAHACLLAISIVTVRAAAPAVPQGKSSTTATNEAGAPIKRDSRPIPLNSGDLIDKAPAAAYKATPLMADETRVVLQLLETVHYLNQPVSNATFEKLVSQFMGDLDDQHLLFTAADEKQFLATYAPTMGKIIRDKGSLEAAFRIFAVYRERADARVGWILDELKKDIDLTTAETYALNRHEAAWPATLEEADDLWRRRLKFEIIPDLLTGKSMEDAKQSLTRRYERMRKNLAEVEPSDIEEMFLSTLTRMYDPHSTFFSAETLDDFSIQMRLSLIGIGAVLSSEDGYCVVKELMPGSPALLSKQINVNDRIVAVAQGNEEPVDVIGMNLRKVVNMIRGQKSTPLTLTLVSSTDAGAKRQVSLVRDVVHLNDSRAKASIQDVPTTSGGMMSVGVIEIPSFYGPVDDGDSGEAGSASMTTDVEELINKLKSAGVKGIVLDLRRNGGGLLGEAVSLTGLFIPKGPVVQVKDNFGQLSWKSDTDGGRVAYDGPLMVLTSRYSASASEIVAGALQNYGRAIIVGDLSTHGKGTVQAVLEMDKFIPRQVLSTGRAGAAKLTVQKFYLPNGASTQNKGVIPDVSLPSIEDFLKIGEADLPNSLTWDTVSPMRFNGQELDMALRDHLKEAARVRVQTLNEFSFLQKRIAFFREREEMKEISINLETRKAMKEDEEKFRAEMKEADASLSALNYEHRDIMLDSVSKDEKPTAALSEPKTSDDEEDPDSLDVHLREGLRILRDAIEVEPDPRDWTRSTATLAALSARRAAMPEAQSN